MAVRRGRRARGNDRLSIPEFFEDRTVFVTGATGFMGKVLLEKLLRSCPGIRRIYILLRPKKGQCLEERLNAMYELPMFIKLKRGDPEAFGKVVPLQGDVSEVGLGLSPEDAQKLKDEVSIVFHVAACVRFDDKLKSAVILNLRGTLETVKLALEMKNLECFLHMSTAYCVKYRDVIEEKIYPAPADWRQILKIAEGLDEHTLEVLAPKLMGTFPNTYTFTKALAEHVVKEYADRIPVCIFRPSIVISAVVEPLPGWVDNFNGPVALIIASGKGIIRTVYSHPDIRSDFIPVDLAVKAMIVSVWNRATALEPISEVPVYNGAAGDVKGVTQRELVELGHHISQEVPLNDILWLPGGYITTSKIIYYIQLLFLHLIPAVLVDSILKFLKKPPMLVRIQRKIFVANMALEYFVTRQWNFLNDKLIALDGEVLEEDRPAFSYYIPDLDLFEYFRAASFGGRQYLMKEDNTDLDQARSHYWKMYWVDKITKCVFLALTVYLAVKLNVIQSISGVIYSFFEFFASLAQ